MIREQHYRCKLAHRARGLAELDRLVGGICAEVDERLDRQDVVRVLELGCGYGTALLELRARYGSRVELHGVNREYGDGNREILLRNAAERGLLGDAAASAIPWPAIAYADVAAGLPFGDDGFDLVYSQVAWLYFGNKIGVLREVSRVLRAGGVAKIDADELTAGLPPEYCRLVEIWQDGRVLPFGDYLQRFGMVLAPAPEGAYVRFGKCEAFGGDLELVFQVDLGGLYRHWDGIKCIYRCVASN
jgi:SAM-dependent methyltransferase